MKYTLFFAALFALSINLHAQSEPAASGDETATAAPATPGEPQVLDAQDQKGQLKETVTSTTETITATPAPTAPAKTETTTTTTTSTTKTGKAIVTQDLKGEIEQIDPEARTFSVGGKSFKFWTSGKVFFKRKLHTLADLKVGDKVAVTYRERSDGTLEASRINK